MEFSIEQIATLIGGEVKGSSEDKITTINAIESASKGSISFLSNPKYENYLYETQASAVIINRSFQPQKTVSTTLILVDDPYSSFTKLLEEYEKLTSSHKTGVEVHSSVANNVIIGDNIYVGSFAYVGSSSKIGNNVKIYPHVFIGEGCEIGDDTIIYSGAKLYKGTKIGNNCVIHSNAVLGSDGFGFAPQKDGSYRKIPQLGNVILEDHVEVGANTTIDCATFGSTIVRKGAKIDNLVQLAHNTEVGENTVIAAQTGVSGSSKIGNNCVVAGQVGIAGHLQIADKVTIAAQSGIPKTVKEKGAVLFGSPAFEKGSYFKSLAVFRKLPELSRKIRELEEKILNLAAVAKKDED
ncbi:MAG: UDP-3-O-(3-hydroxymyristoyl)glucosamine N-acyltransferase [Bacteroidota bacterium]